MAPAITPKRYTISPWIFFAVLFGIVIWKLVEYHCFPDPLVLSRSRSQYWGRASVGSSRGVIRDSLGNDLAHSVTTSSFFIDPMHWSPSDAPALRGLVPDAVVEQISHVLKGRYVRVARKVSPDLAQKILTLKLKGLYEEKEKKREYPHGALLSHVLGFCDADGAGLSGLELAWDSTLYEPPGYRILSRHARGRALNGQRDGSLAAVTLTIDIRIQYILEKRLNEAAVQHKAKWGAALCLDPNTGALLAMASWPFFNPSNRDELDSSSIVNNTVGRAYEPGSTFKPIFMGIALESGLVRANETFNCPARLKVADGFITEAYKRAMGTLSTAEILVKSSNVGMAQIGVRSTPLDMYRTLLTWGFGKASDVELGKTEKGLLASPGQWRGVMPANVSIGQGIAVTPLQLAMGMTAVVNGGKLLSPYLVREAVDPAGEVVYRGSRHAAREVLTPATCRWLRTVMRESVAVGTGWRAETPVTRLAGKTGTAQVAEKGKYVEGRYVSSFLGFWPYENPRYLLLFVLGEPSAGQYYGGEVAAPVVKKIVEDMAELKIFGSEAIL
ncbi:MAG: penicillin-binding protein 2 [Synergistaceae bacterium]|nr:penicillin-binding protein 2 [Synergistaceae bacterium]